MPFGIGPLELIIVLVIILVIFGPKRLPQAGRSLGQGLREFKDSVTGKEERSEAPRPNEIPPGDARQATSVPPEEPSSSEAAPAQAPPAEASPAEASRAFGRDD